MTLPTFLLFSLIFYFIPNEGRGPLTLSALGLYILSPTSF
jgi:hypothetical protein